MKLSRRRRTVLPIDLGQGDEALGYITEIGNDDGRIPLRSLIGRRKRRSVSFNDPSYSKQWHLNSPSGLDINVIPVWEKGYTGMGVVVTIVRSACFLIHSLAAEACGVNFLVYACLDARAR
jgi:hypothetical protein